MLASKDLYLSESHTYKSKQSLIFFHALINWGSFLVILSFSSNICSQFSSLTLAASGRYMEWNAARGGSRVAATSKMERFVIIVNGFQPLTINTKAHLGCCSTPRSVSGCYVNCLLWILPLYRVVLRIGILLGLVQNGKCSILTVGQCY